MTYSLSTAWNHLRHKSGAGMIDEIRSIGFDTAELNFALTEKMVEEIISLKDAGDIKISSLHNMCPLPAEISPRDASPDYYSLAAMDSSERGRAVEAAKRTVSFAARLGARAVVLHAGRIEMEDNTRRLAGLVGDKAPFERLKSEMVRERSEKRSGYLDNAIESLGRIVPHARKMGIAVGVENRYYYREIPVADELEEIFRNFGPGELRYWHDVGHAEVFDTLGLASHASLLEKFSTRLIGMHLHDIINVIDDHRPPGTGRFDFGRLRPYIKKETLMVIEAHCPAHGEDIKRSVEYLRRTLE